MQLKKKAGSLISEMVYDILMPIVAAIFVITGRGKTCQVNVATWMTGIMGAYLGDFILALYQYHYIKVSRQESILIMALRFIVLNFLVGWLIYGNVIYYDKTSPQGCDQGVRLGVFLMLLVGYFEMMKCFCMGLFVCILVPYLIFAVRRARRPNWMPAAPRFIQALYKTKFNKEINQAQTECPICMVDYVESDEITPLPCDDKHYFHSKCI